jgi:hypothetical protein
MNKLIDTTILIQCHLGDTRIIDHAMELSDNIIIFNDASSLDLSNYENISKIKIIDSDKYYGTYEECFKRTLPLITTKYILKVNSGDSIIYVEEPRPGFDIFLANYARNSELSNSNINLNAETCITGSVIPTELYKDLLSRFEFNRSKKFGIYAKQVILQSNQKYYQPFEKSYDFTFDMWGGRISYFKLK